ncbi:chorismate lyase, partial [Vibrio sp. 10N.222.51.A6]
QQGDVPLGLTVFSAENVDRDALQVGWVIAGDERLLARRSRLWMNHKPMLVAELFLPTSPIYSKESV